MSRVIVIGAGFAGIACARLLHAQGHSVRVLEARDRIGGRTRTDTIGGRVVDVGGQWIGAGHDRLRELTRAAGLDVRPQYTEGSKLLQLSTDAPGRVRRYDGLIPKVSWPALAELELAIRSLERKARRIDPAAPWEADRAEAWDARTLASWARLRFRTRGGREVFDAAVRAVMTAEPSALSFLHFLFYCASNDGFEALTSTRDGAQADIVVGGVPAVARWMAAPFTDGVHLNEPVTRVQQSQDGVSVTTTTGCYQAERVVITVPPALLGGIEFAPRLPVARARVASQSPMGSVIKAVVAYDRPFWREAGLSGEAVSHSLPFNTVLDASWPEADGGALVGFFDGKPAMDYADADQATRRQAVIDSLVQYFGPQAATPISYADYNWLADDWARGCYTGVMPPGVMTTVGHTLRIPCGRVHWAGTETARRWTGYIEGAIESGERAAEEIIAALT